MSVAHAAKQEISLQELSGQSNAYYGSSSYIAKSAVQKQKELWSEISATAGKKGSWPGLTLAGIFVEDMEPTFNTAGDAMPAGRKKYIHTVGNVAKCKWVSAGGHPYTGIFKGATHGLVRLSSAAEPALTTMQPLAPGMGLKFLRDGVDSANLVAMYSTEGTPHDWNFFSKDFYNHIGAAMSFSLKGLSKVFSWATDYIQEVGLSDFARYDERGHKTSPVFPYSLRFQPDASVHTLFPTSGTSSYMAYVDQLG